MSEYEVKNAIELQHAVTTTTTIKQPQVELQIVEHNPGFPEHGQENVVTAATSEHEDPTMQVNAIKTQEEQDKDTSELIAQATAAAIEAAANAIDVSAAADAALAANALDFSATEIKTELPPPDVKPEQLQAIDEAIPAETKASRKRKTEDDKAGLSVKKSNQSHEEQLAARREKDRQRYANMTPEQRRIYNAKRREQYHRQNEKSRQKRRERERARYHSLSSDKAKERNARRAKLERERYQKLSPEELEAKNRKRRERAALARQKKEAEKSSVASTASVGTASQQQPALPTTIVAPATLQPQQTAVEAPPAPVLAPVAATTEPSVNGNQVATVPAAVNHTMASAPAVASDPPAVGATVVKTEPDLMEVVNPPVAATTNAPPAIATEVPNIPVPAETPALETAATAGDVVGQTEVGAHPDPSNPVPVGAGEAMNQAVNVQNTELSKHGATV